jgi:hypothetical protein
VSAAETAILPERWTLTPEGTSCDGEHALDVQVYMDEEELLHVRHPVEGWDESVGINGDVDEDWTVLRDPLHPDFADLIPDEQWSTFLKLVDALQLIATVKANRGLTFGDWLDGGKADEPYPLLNIVDLRQVASAPPEMLVDDRLVRGVPHVWFGPPEQAKTWLAMDTVADLLRRGEAVVWVDMESGQAEVRERLSDAFGLTDEEMERLVYLEMPIVEVKDEVRRQWFDMLDERRPALIVVDAQQGVLASADLNENSSSDVLRWDAAFLMPARQRIGATSLMLDHTGHDGMKERGASGKRGLARVTLKFSSTAFSRDHVGKLTVTVEKNTRSAPIPAEQRFKIGGTPFVLEPVEPTLGDAMASTSEWNELLVKVEAAIRESGEKGVSPRGLRDLVSGRPEKLADACISLYEKGAVQRKPGKTTGFVYWIPSPVDPGSATQTPGRDPLMGSTSGSTSDPLGSGIHYGKKTASTSRSKRKQVDTTGGGKA